ncbi:MAG: HAMP domain-containing histidine kinase [Syntrophobacterales bacterium]|nr:HAMP domain-containing histidine kinase [Syntrophobacterales bacterium]
MFSKRSDKIGLTFSVKLSVLYALFFVISSIGLFFVAYYVIHNLVEQREHEIISNRIDEYRAWYKEGGVTALKARFDEQSASTKDAYFVRIISPNGNALFVSIPRKFRGLDTSRLRIVQSPQKDLWISIKGQAEKDAWTVGMAKLPGELTLQVGKSTTQSREFLSYFRTIFLIFVVLILLLGIAGGGFLTFRAIRPIRRLIQTVRNILKTGKTSMRVPVSSGRGEMEELVSLFNQMLDRNDSLIQVMRNSLDNVAHDLRTPMTRLRGSAELALQDSKNRDSCLEALADCMEESESVLTMLNVLMDVAEAETGVMKLDVTDVSVREVVHSAVELYEMVAEEKNISVIEDLSDEIIIRVDQIRFKQVIANLIDNALKYSSEGGYVNISASKKGDLVSISISDEGIGIPRSEMDKIFDRLYRGDHSRSQRGLGLGLSLVRAIVQAHGGTVKVESEPNKGSTFIIEI